MSMRAASLQKTDALVGAGIAVQYGIKGVGQNPQNLDTNCIDLVHEMSQGGFTALDMVVAQDSATWSAAGSASVTRDVIGPNNFASLLLGLTSQHFRLWGMSCFVTFDAAGLAAFAGKPIGVELAILAVASPTFSVPVHQERFTVPAAGLTIRLSMNPILWKGVVANGHVLRASLISYDGTVFPANTTGRIWIHGVRTPINWQPPR